MDVYYINLKKRLDRREYMESQFSRLGMPFQRIPAIDGSLPEMQEAIKKIGTGFTGRPLGANAYACFLSHRNAWKKLANSNQTHAMIFEDDVLIASDLGQYIEKNWVPIDADIVKMETWGGGVSVERRRLNAGSRSLARLKSKHYGAAGYVLSQNAARRLLKETEIFIDPVDAVLFHPKSSVSSSMIIYQMIPAPVVQGDRPIAGQAGQSWAINSMPARYNEPEGQIIRKKKRKQKWLRDLTRNARNFILRRESMVVPYG
jgi:glycosyl transferase family 25